MVTGLWGKKIGMTQVFSKENLVVPATVVDISGWYVTNIKTKERDGYNAVQVGCVRNRYLDKKFDINWIKKSKEYFLFIREIRLNKNVSEMAENPIVIGQAADFRSILSEGSSVDVFGVNKGCGFAGVVKRHGFRGGSASHGDTMGRAPGSLSNFCTQGRVPKGKKMPGHMGNRSHSVKNIEIIQVKEDSPIVVLKGSIPGRSRSLVFLRTEKVI
ncbi:MAG: hypothetical protein ACD_19C00291G0004 [uncultured bacterium]|jgi:large subunit ribosomal protein L3|nr:MAG: hypothetical protein ACD_19C00291G0004 [uncultured bacterium]KKP29576.1 MAG: 50S ribosomal protein L3 [candidate division TM6 bacterium GW2011_GWF2_30_66]